MPRMMPLAISLGVGALSGIVQNQDEKAGRTELLKQWSTFVDAGAFLGGILMEATGMGYEFAEPLTVAGAALVGRRAGYSLAKGTLTAPRYAPAPAFAMPAQSFSPAPRVAASVNKQPTMGIV